MSNTITEIDSLVQSLYSKKKYSELAALSRIFSEKFLEKLEIILNSENIEKKNQVRYDVSCGWIDKIPLALFTKKELDLNKNPITGKVELGDLLLVYTNSQTNKSGASQIKESRATIIQAKIAIEAHPKVPITSIPKSKCNSTSKEFALLSNWPEFDLYQTSKSATPLLTKVNLLKGKKNAKYGGFFKNSWHFGDPVKNQICDKTFGKLIVDLISGSEGDNFIDGNTTTDWNKLINLIIKICGEYKLPGYIFGKKRLNRFLSLLRGKTATLLHFFFFFPPFFFEEPKFCVFVINRIEEVEIIEN